MDSCVVTGNAVQLPTQTTVASGQRRSKLSVAEHRCCPTSRRLCRMPGWYRIVTDRGVLRRATLTGLGVGTVLTAVNQGERLLAGSLQASALLSIIVSYLAPFLV